MKRLKTSESLYKVIVWYTKAFKFTNLLFSNDVLRFGTPQAPPFAFISLLTVWLYKNWISFIILVTVWSYFSFPDKEQDKSDHLISARFSWSLSNQEILTPQLQDDGAVFFCVLLNFINNFVSTHVNWTQCSFEFCYTSFFSYMLPKYANFCMFLTKGFMQSAASKGP